MSRRIHLWVACLAALACGACGQTAPTSPSGQQSFLSGTWHGTVTVQVNPGDPDAPPQTVGATTWTFAVVPDTNQQTFTATIQSQNPWLVISTTGTTAITPGNTPPAQISTQGGYDSPRGCRGTFGSFGTAEASRIDADFTGTDCDHATFSGRVVLTKE